MINRKCKKDDCKNIAIYQISIESKFGRIVLVRCDECANNKESQETLGYTIPLNAILIKDK